MYMAEGDMDGIRFMGIPTTNRRAASRGDARFTPVTYVTPSSPLTAT